MAGSANQPPGENGPPGPPGNQGGPPPQPQQGQPHPSQLYQQPPPQHHPQHSPHPPPPHQQNHGPHNPHHPHPQQPPPQQHMMMQYADPSTVGYGVHHQVAPGAQVSHPQHPPHHQQAAHLQPPPPPQFQQHPQQHQQNPPPPRSRGPMSAGPSSMAPPSSTDGMGNESDDGEGGQGDGSPDAPQKRKRRRQALSCTECKRRKIKCDRQNPCGPCSRRGEHDKCKWHVIEPIEKFVTRSEYDDLKAKIENLEAVITQLTGQPIPSFAYPPPLPGQPAGMPIAVGPSGQPLVGGMAPPPPHLLAPKGPIPPNIPPGHMPPPGGYVWATPMSHPGPPHQQGPPPNQQGGPQPMVVDPSLQGHPSQQQPSPQQSQQQPQQPPQQSQPPPQQGGPEGQPSDGQPQPQQGGSSKKGEAQTHQHHQPHHTMIHPDGQMTEMNQVEGAVGTGEMRLRRTLDIPNPNSSKDNRHNITSTISNNNASGVVGDGPGNGNGNGEEGGNRSRSRGNEEDNIPNARNISIAQNGVHTNPNNNNHHSSLSSSLSSPYPHPFTSHSHSSQSQSLIHPSHLPHVPSRSQSHSPSSQSLTGSLRIIPHFPDSTISHLGLGANPGGSLGVSISINSTHPTSLSPTSISHILRNIIPSISQSAINFFFDFVRFGGLCGLAAIVGRREIQAIADEYNLWLSTDSGAHGERKDGYVQKPSHAQMALLWIVLYHGYSSMDMFDNRFKGLISSLDEFHQVSIALFHSCQDELAHVDLASTREVEVLQAIILLSAIPLTLSSPSWQYFSMTTLLATRLAQNLRLSHLGYEHNSDPSQIHHRETLRRIWHALVILDWSYAHHLPYPGSSLIVARHFDTATPLDINLDDLDTASSALYSDRSLRKIPNEVAILRMWIGIARFENLLDIHMETKDSAKERAAVDDFEKGLRAVWEELPVYLKWRDEELERQHPAIFWQRSSVTIAFNIRLITLYRRYLVPVPQGKPNGAISQSRARKVSVYAAEKIIDLTLEMNKIEFVGRRWWGVLLHSFRAAVILLLDNHLVKEVNRKHTILLSRAERILAISQILLSASSLSPIARKASLVLRHFLDESGNPTVHSAPPSTRPRDPNASVDWEEAPEKRPKIDEMNPFGSSHHTRKSHSPLPPTIPSTPDEATSGSPMDQSSDNMSSKESSTDNHNRGSPLPVYPWHAILDLELDVEVEESTLNA